jgi:CRISPR system Cascade subunit CasD
MTMSILILRLAGPLQAWGTNSKLADRSTGLYPSKSAVLGMIAAAQGRSRDADISDLAAYPFGVAIRRPGSPVSDTQTAIAGGAPYRTAKDSERYFFHKAYLQDAVFFVGVQCDGDTARELAGALRRPAFPLYLGRRGCPVTQPLIIGISEEPMENALTDAALADPQQSFERENVHIRLIVERAGGDMVRDVPVSFDPRKRTFSGRRVMERGAAHVSEQSDP